MEDQLKAVEWARKQKKKILEKNYKDNNPPGGLCDMYQEFWTHIYELS